MMATMADTPQRRYPYLVGSVRPALPQDRPAIQRVLTLAFLDDPVMRWWMRDDQHLPEAMMDLFGVLTGDDAPQSWHLDVIDGEDGELAAAAIWIPPGAPGPNGSFLEELATLPRLVRWCGLKRLPRVFRLMSCNDRYRPRDIPHVYLYFIGVAPGLVRAGYGSALLRHALEWADHSLLPVFVENSRRTSLPFYVSHGFRVLGRVRAAKSAPYEHLLWRDAPGAPHAAPDIKIKE